MCGVRLRVPLWLASPQEQRRIYDESTKFWAKVLNDLRNRGVQDILIAVVDGLKGFPQAIEAAFPQTQVQTCIVHLLRHSMSFASYKDRKAVAVALKAVYSAIDAAAAAA